MNMTPIKKVPEMLSPIFITPELRCNVPVWFSPGLDPTQFITELAVSTLYLTVVFSAFTSFTSWFYFFSIR